MGSAIRNLAEERLEEWSHRRPERPDLLDDSLQMPDDLAKVGLNALSFTILNQGLDRLGQPLQATNVALPDFNEPRQELLVDVLRIIFRGVEEKDRHFAKSPAFQFAPRVRALNATALLDRFNVKAGRVVRYLERLLFLIENKQDSAFFEHCVYAVYSKLLTQRMFFRLVAKTGLNQAERQEIGVNDDDARCSNPAAPEFRSDMAAGLFPAHRT